MAVMSLSVHFGALRTRELRNLLQDEDKINHIIRCSEKFQGLQRAAEKRLLSNQKMAKISLSQKTQFRDAKLLLAMKYKELEKLRSIIQAKQEQLVGKHSVHYYQQCLLKKINRAEEECEWDISPNSCCFRGLRRGKHRWQISWIPFSPCKNSNTSG
ncbi:vacuolar protein sorting-associated protein 37D-like isoform X4 [Micropterus dolomieu]|uniref:vacuolar protein sorting-associated protein 37D-like isoform X4 n=1 Tax=Micropterus dolomieu TaxID=147949 RepID=UPI001E8D76A1|nr:vacuolar protein sorting-associated protein 37D-like isoform X4 [Micropterus dolomieu]